MMEHNMTCKKCGHKVGRVIACARELDCVDPSSRHYHCLSKGGCDDLCGISGTCEPIHDREMVTLTDHHQIAV